MKECDLSPRHRLVDSWLVGLESVGLFNAHIGKIAV